MSQERKLINRNNRTLNRRLEFKIKTDFVVLEI